MEQITRCTISAKTNAESTPNPLHERIIGLQYIDNDSCRGVIVTLVASEPVTLKV